MDIYLTSLALGGVGLVAMAASGIGQHGHGGHGGGHDVGHAGHDVHVGGHGHGHAGGGHGGVHDVGHAGAHAGSHAGSHVGANGAHAAAHNAEAHVGASHAASGHATHSSTGTNLLLSLMSPRLLFSVCLGVGTSGFLLRPLLGEPLLFAASLAGGVLFEAVLVRPLWNSLFRFASKPALTLESAVAGEALAVTNFDANGQGLISIEMDGQVVQLLGTLQSDDRAMSIRIAAGTRLRVEDVDAARNRCTVSLL